jgi:hypothetical protein
VKVLDAEFRPPVANPSLVSCLVFAACAALGALLWMLTAAPLFGYGGAAATCALALVVIHPLFVAPTVPRGVATAGVAFALAVPIACLRPSPFEAFTAGSFLLGIVRSALLYPRPFARALLLETGLGGGGLLALLFFYDGGLSGAVFGFWSFWLVQAGIALVPGDASPPEHRPVDPFERAQAAALLVLDRRR